VITLAGGALAASSPNAFDQPGTLGFLVVFGMGVILFFVFRSMARHLRKVHAAAAAEEARKEEAAEAAAASAPKDQGGAS
jgi:hypothetical protein